MDATHQLDIVYLPANEQAGGLLPHQVQAFRTTINGFFAGSEFGLCMPGLPIVLDLPKVKARLYIPAKNTWVKERTVLDVLYSFEPNKQEVGACNRFYMAPIEWMK